MNDWRGQFPGVEECLDSDLRDGVWDEKAHQWLLFPASHFRESDDGEFLIINSPGPGTEVGFRRGRRGIWIHYTLEPRYAYTARSARIFMKPFGASRIRC
jgi:hypothetical protein